MKRLAIIIISLFAALLSAAGGISVHAAESQTVYPEDADFIKRLSFSSLSGYAVGADKYYFTEGNILYIFDGEILSRYTHTGTVTAIDYDSEVYFSDAEKTYTLKENNGVYSAEEYESAYTFADPSVITCKDGIYRLTDGKLGFCPDSEDTFIPLEGNYSHLRIYGGYVYALRDNSIYKLDGADAEALPFTYFYDCASKDEIAAGNTAENLKNYQLTFLTVKAGTFMTPVDLTVLGETFKTEETVICPEDCVVLLLCYTGNAAIIAIKDKSYILLASKTSEIKINCYKEPEFEHAQITGESIYASPYSVAATSVLTGATDKKVTVLNKLEFEEVLWLVYYEVEYETQDGAKAVGYVADGLLDRDIISDNKDPSVIEDPNYSESSGTKTVLLILAVVFLVLIAIGYLAYISSGKRKNKNKDKKKKEEEK